jgi:hypothetical protein
MRKVVDRPYMVSVVLSHEEMSWLRELAQIERVTEERVLRRALERFRKRVLKRQGIRKEGRHSAGGSGGLKARSAHEGAARLTRRGTGQWDSGKVGFGSWLCEDGTGETALRKLILQMGDWQTKVLSFPVLGATSEKFILAIVLLDALLNGQGHERPIEAPSWQVRSVRCSLQS